MPLDSNRLASRVRELLRQGPAPGGTRGDVRPIAPGSPGSPGDESPRELQYVPEEAVPVSPDAPSGCVIIERHFDLDVAHGAERLAGYAGVIERCIPALAVLAADDRAAGSTGRERPSRLDFGGGSRALRDDRQRPGVPTGGPLLFFDLETTGLSGGAGTIAFLVGCGYFDAGGFHTRQYFLAGYEAEHELLGHLAALTREFGGLVTFNGRTFDVPLIDTRYHFHRLASPFEAMPHFDMLHPARRLWRRRGSETAPAGRTRAGRDRGTEPLPDSSSCALGALEEALLGVSRVGDVPGSEIPARYFHYLRSGDLEPLQAVFEHNRLDILSLAALTALGMRIVDDGPDALRTSHEALAMGQLYAGLCRHDEAEACFARAVALDGGSGKDGRPSAGGAFGAEALRRLAIQRRRQQRFDEAAEAWTGILDAGVRGSLAQEARCALAIHHEHRRRDPETARTVAARALAAERDPAAIEAWRHRLSRLNRKLGLTGSKG